MFSRHRFESLLATLGLFLTCCLQPSGAEVKMPGIFGDHMVLQQQVKIPIWGWAAPGEKVTVTLSGSTAATTAGGDGSWRVDLAPLPASTPHDAAQTLTVAGSNTITFHDMLVGEVWLASGQSNMEFGLGMVDHGADEIAKAHEPMLRLFCVPKIPSLTPQKDIGAVSPDSFIGHWEVCTPESVAQAGGWSGFTAVGYYFGREIQHARGCPVGMIESSWGGTPAQAWTSISGLQKDPALAHYVTEYQGVLTNFPKAQAAFAQLSADTMAAKAKWDTEVGNAYRALVDAWNQQVTAAHVKGETPPPPPPSPSRPEPQMPPSPEGGGNNPGNLYNGMIAPLIPYAIKGAIWYQGESNANSVPDSEEYRILFPRMILDWREKWAQGDFPFLFVQLASYGDPAKGPTDGAWPYLRESQLKTLALPNTGMASALDVGDPYNIHPADKLDVGLRLALVAKHVAYGQELVYSGPVFDSMRVDGAKVILSFKDVGGGLKIGAPPWEPADIPVRSAPTELTGFGIAGADRNWVWAKAVIEGDTVVVSSDKVAAPVAVRYGWNQSPPVDLYNKEGLPAVPFRTDNWD